MCVELETGAVGVGVGVSGRGCGTCLYTVDLVSWAQCEAGSKRQKRRSSRRDNHSYLVAVMCGSRSRSSQATEFQKRAKVGACDNAMTPAHKQSGCGWRLSRPSNRTTEDIQCKPVRTQDGLPGSLRPCCVPTPELLQPTEWPAGAHTRTPLWILRNSHRASTAQSNPTLVKTPTHYSLRQISHTFSTISVRL